VLVPLRVHEGKDVDGGVGHDQPLDEVEGGRRQEHQFHAVLIELDRVDFVVGEGLVHVVVLSDVIEIIKSNHISHILIEAFEFQGQDGLVGDDLGGLSVIELPQVALLAVVRGQPMRLLEDPPQQPSDLLIHLERALEVVEEGFVA